MAEDRGIKVVQSLPVQMTTQDFASQSQQIASENPDALVMLLIAPQSVTALGQLKDAGYDGPGRGHVGPGRRQHLRGRRRRERPDLPGALLHGARDESSKAFTEAFQAKYDKDPNPYNADGYDAMWWIARAIKASGDSSREGIQRGPGAGRVRGLHGAMGDVTFEGNDARVPGILVQWQDGKESLVE